MARLTGNLSEQDKAGRDRYVEDEEFKAVCEKGHYTLQDAMDLALLIGQQPANVLKRTRRHTAFWSLSRDACGDARRLLRPSGFASERHPSLTQRLRRRTAFKLHRNRKG